MKFLQVHTFYDAYLSEFYRTRPGLESQPFQAQLAEMVRDGFAGSHLFAPYLKALGYDSQLVIANAIPSQVMWCHEYSAQFDEHKWQADIFRQQVDAIDPDILYITCPITFDSSFVRSLKKRPRIVMGWRAADIPEGTDFREFQLVLSSDSVSRKRLLELGAKAVRHFVPGVPKFLSEVVASEQKSVDVVFSGLHSSQHLRRNDILKQVGKAPLGWRGEFSLAYYLLTVDPSEVALGIAMYDRGPRFGVEMHRALAQGRIALNGIGDAFKGEAGNMRQFEVTASKTLLLTEEHETLQQYFTPGREVETFKDPAELLDKIYYYLDRPDKREEIAQAGYQRYLKDHCMEVRVQEFNDILKQLLAKERSPHPLNGHHVKDTKLERMSIKHIVTDLNSSQSTNAVVCAGELLKSTPESLELRYLFALGLAREGKIDAAKQALTILLSSDSSHVLARTLLDELSPAASPSTAQPEPELTSKLLARTVELLEAGKARQALDATIEAKKSRTPVRDLDYLRAICFIKLGQIFDAREALKEELRYFPDSNLANTLLQQVEAEIGSSTRIEGGDEFRSLVEAVRPYTMLGEERLFSLYSLAKHACESNIPGNFVECGVAGGGSSALIAFVLKRYSSVPRFHFALDSFSGMPTPGEHDIHRGVHAEDTGWGSGTCAAPESSLLEICEKLGVADLVVPIKGYFEDTIPTRRDSLGMIALLHLDADWYESTKVILGNLYSRVSDGGYLQIDDYGYWDGCRRAVEEFAKERSITFHFAHLDASGVCCVKPELFRANPLVDNAAIDAFLADDQEAHGSELRMSRNERFQLHYCVQRHINPNGIPIRFVEMGCHSGSAAGLLASAFARLGPPVEGFTNLTANDLRDHFERDGNYAKFIFYNADLDYERATENIAQCYTLLAPEGILVLHHYLPALNDRNREAILFHHAGKEPGIRKVCEEILQKQSGAQSLSLPLLSPEDPTQTQAHLPIIPGVFSTIRAYRIPQAKS